MARGRESQEEMETQRAAVVEVDLSLKRQRTSSERAWGNSLTRPLGGPEQQTQKIATRRGRGGGGSLSLPRPPLPGASRGAGGSARQGGRAPPAAESLRRLESVAALGPWSPGPHGESSPRTGRCDCWGLSVRRCFRRCCPEFPHFAEGNTEAARRLCARLYFRGRFFCKLSFVSSHWGEGRLLRMCSQARDGREEDEPAGQGASSS